VRMMDEFKHRMKLKNDDDKNYVRLMAALMTAFAVAFFAGAVVNPRSALSLLCPCFAAAGLRYWLRFFSLNRKNTR